ncbi:peptide deformylase [Nocardia wallacei]|uniref:peptide deformylase n=1 Tax=Nocardia wallacei TaxID=480035 RepID=UPI0024562840|nr:peptide deformylase [Nocardia wallacei]
MSEPIGGIARIGHPILRRLSASVGADGLEKFDLDELSRCLSAVLHRYRADGTAAPLVGTAVRVIAVDPANMCQVRRLSGVESGVLVHYDPELTPLAAETVLDYEACLCIPGVVGAVARPSSIHYRATTGDGEQVDWELHGRAARVVAHQVDHLDGVLFLDRAEPRSLCTPRALRTLYLKNIETARAALEF